jgi:predicted RNA-binding protein with RPS1 domain
MAKCVQLAACLFCFLPSPVRCTRDRDDLHGRGALKRSVSLLHIRTHRDLMPQRRRTTLLPFFFTLIPDMWFLCWTAALWVGGPTATEAWQSSSSSSSFVWHGQRRHRPRVVAAPWKEEPNRPFRGQTKAVTTTSATHTSVSKEEQQPTPHRYSYYRSPAHQNKWQRRLDLATEVYVGQELQATVVQELLDGRTGPKLFVDVGVARYRPHMAHTANTDSDNDDADNGDGASTNKPQPRRKDWPLVHAMLRLPRGKASVTRKRASRLRKRPHFPVYVSRIRLGNAALEVSLEPPVVADKPATSSSTMTPPPSSPPHVGQVVQGRVVRVYDYGVVVDLHQSLRQGRHGLLHISTVADLMGRYVDHADGLRAVGLHEGARVELQIDAIQPRPDSSNHSSSQRKPLIALGFTEQTKLEAAQSRPNRPPKSEASTASQSSSPPSLSPEEEQAWAAFAANPSSALAEDTSPINDENDDYGDDDDDEEEDDYDEDREIEDALGLGYY